MVASTLRYLVEDTCAVPRETPDLGIPDQTMMIFHRCFTSWGHRFWSCCLFVTLVERLHLARSFLRRC
jgi:hypothetical protein